MNERQGNYSERFPLTPQDYAMKIRGYFDDRVDSIDFGMWKIALHDILVVRQLEEEKKVVTEKLNETHEKEDRIEAVKVSLLWQWKTEETRDKGLSILYRPAFRQLSVDAMNMELAFEQEGKANPAEATNRELMLVEEYAARLPKPK